MWPLPVVVAVAALGAAVLAAAPAPPPAFPWFDPSISFEARAAMLVGNMTQLERITQLVKYSPAIERLGVPGYNWHMEAAHGVATGGDVTVFPCSLARAASFNLETERAVAAVTQREARAKWNMYQRATNHTPAYNSEGLSLTLYAPEINLCRDPRWGRCQESRGECPHLTARLTVAFVKALQARNGSKYLPVSAMLKDFPVYNLESDQPVGGTDWQERLRYNAVVNAADMAQTFLPAFRAGTVEAGVETIMTSYHAVNGIPATAHPMLQSVLRDEWGFNGSVVSDGGAVSYILNFKYLNLSMTDNITAAAAAALNAGVDMNSGGFVRQPNPPSCKGCGPNMTGFAYEHLPAALAAGMVDAEALMRSATRLFELRMKLGFFDPPDLVPYSKLGWADVDTAASRALARASARESLVLLRTNGDLPWSPDSIRKLAVIGPTANSTDVLLSNYNAPCGDITRYVNAKLPGKNCTLTSVLAGARAALPDATVAYEQGCELNSTDARGIDAAAAAAAASDAAILVVGLISGLGHPAEPALENEAHDRVNLTLPGVQAELVHRVLAAQPRTIVVVISGSAVSIPSLMAPGAPPLPALIQQFYPGEEGGNALMDAVFGRVDFAGKLPVTVLRGVADLPPYLEQNMSLAPGRTFRFVDPGLPLFPFGYGLKRHTFAYSDLVLSTRLALDDGPPAAVTVSFTLAAAAQGQTSVPPIAAEVVQVYVSCDSQPGSTGPAPFDGGSAVPRWDLRHFARITLAANETRRVSATIPVQDLALAAEDGSLRVLPGRYTFWVGGTSPGTPARLLRPAATWGPQPPIAASLAIALSATGAVRFVGAS